MRDTWCAKGFSTTLSYDTHHRSALRKSIWVRRPRPHATCHPSLTLPTSIHKPIPTDCPSHHILLAILQTIVAMFNLNLNCAVTTTTLLSLLLQQFMCQEATAFLSLSTYAKAVAATPARTSTSSMREDSAGNGVDTSRRRRCVVGSLAAKGGVGGGDDMTKIAKRNPPESLLDRPWDVEVLLHGERHIITVQPGDSILEAVSSLILSGCRVMLTQKLCGCQQLRFGPAVLRHPGS